MFARVVRYSIEPERVGEALAAFDVAAKQIGALDGIHGAYVMEDHESGRIITVTFWDNQQAMEASEVRASALRQEALRDVDGEIESVERVRVATELGET